LYEEHIGYFYGAGSSLDKYIIYAYNELYKI